MHFHAFYPLAREVRKRATIRDDIKVARSHKNILKKEKLIRHYKRDLLQSPSVVYEKGDTV